MCQAKKERHFTEQTVTDLDDVKKAVKSFKYEEKDLESNESMFEKARSNLRRSNKIMKAKRRLQRIVNKELIKKINEYKDKMVSTETFNPSSYKEMLGIETNSILGDKNNDNNKNEKYDNTSLKFYESDISI